MLEPTAIGGTGYPRLGACHLGPVRRPPGATRKAAPSLTPGGPRLLSDPFSRHRRRGTSVTTSCRELEYSGRELAGEGMS